MDDHEWHPWRTQLEATHRLTGVIQETGQDALVVVDLVTWGPTMKAAMKTGEVAFKVMLEASGIELVDERP